MTHMKRKIIILAVFIAAAALAVCALLISGGKEPAEASSQPKEKAARVELSTENFFDYFEYMEQRQSQKTGEGDVTSVQISYGFRLKEGFEAAEGYESDLKIRFRAEGIVNQGSYTVDFSTLRYRGETQSTERVEIDEELQFWPKGNRSTLYQYGAYTTACIIYMENMTLTEVSGSIYLKAA